MADTVKERCCFITEGKRCEKEAEFGIMENGRTDPDNCTVSCAAHVGEMLGTTNGFPECNEWTVWNISEEK